MSVAASASAQDAPPTLQDMHVVGRVLMFQDSRPSGALVLVVPYVAANTASRTEAQNIAALLSGGLQVGGVMLHPLVVEQDALASAGHYDAVLATAGLDEAMLRTALTKRRVPCLTLHPAQVEQGSCVVAIRSAPNVSILVSNANASLAGVHFATAFRMMVREL